MMDEEIKENGKRGVGYIVSSVVLCLSVALCLIVVTVTLTKGYVSVFGYSMFRVVTGSMEPTIPVGAAVINKETDINSIEINDIISFRSVESDHFGVIVTHRVVRKTSDENGNILLETRGDANVVSDGYYVRETNLIGRVIWYSGKESVITNMLSFITGKTGFFLCLVFPILLITGLILQNSVKNMRKEIESVRNEIEKEKNKEMLPGYETLTAEDYEKIYLSLKNELEEELKNSVKGVSEKTE